MNSINTNSNELSKLDFEYSLKKSIELARSKYKKGIDVSIGFFVLYDSAFPGECLLNILKETEGFAPIIILIPDTMRGHENMIFQLQKSYKSLSKKYDNIYMGYDIEKQSFNDFSKILDYVCISNPYDCITHDFFKIRYLLKNSVIPFFINYTFSVSLYDRKVIAQDEFNFFWKIFSSTQENFIELVNFSQMKGINSVVVGYPKIDALARTVVKPRTRKIIIIAPHHTVSQWEGGVNISSFLKHANFFLELPSLYPDIDFVFRPHPLLFVNLKQEKLWGEEVSNNYIKSLTKNENVRYSEESDYLDLFANSDALIHDCGSFVAEYLFTEKPSCFILSRPSVIADEFSPIGENCLQHHYHATSQKDIISFIDYVVVSENDTMKMERLKFINKNLKINYPNSSQKILEEILLDLK